MTTAAASALRDAAVYRRGTAGDGGRIASVDIVRGAVMVFMALDHVRDFTSRTHFQPEDLSRASAALFFTRWITHFCAPTFFLLAGVGIGIAMQRGRSVAAMSRYLVTRGLWLLVLELIITPIGWRLSFNLFPAFALVLWALGWSMILMAALIRLPHRGLAIGALVVIAAHNMLDGIPPQAFGSMAWLWNVLHVPGFVVPGVLLVAYPLIPWVAVMALGFVFADVYTWDAARRRRSLLVWGAAATVLFLALRALNGYGDPGPWSGQRSAALSVASFFNVRKYPPSLLFLLMTLGPATIALALTESARGRVARWLAVYGRVPMFYYVVHIFVAHLAGVAIAFAQSGRFMTIPVFTNPDGIPPWYGLSLAGVYVAWAAVVAVMYYPCKAMARLKDRRRDWWLSYL
jgi:uncharacterized membrane protein